MTTGQPSRPQRHVSAVSGIWVRFVIMYNLCPPLPSCQRTAAIIPQFQHRVQIKGDAKPGIHCMTLVRLWNGVNYKSSCFRTGFALEMPLEAWMEARSLTPSDEARVLFPHQLVSRAFGRTMLGDQFSRSNHRTRPSKFKDWPTKPRSEYRWNPSAYRAFRTGRL